MKKRCCYLEDMKDETPKEKYILGTNDKEEIILKKINQETSKEINIIFDTSENTNVMDDVLKQLTKYYIEDILKIQM